MSGLLCLNHSTKREMCRGKTTYSHLECSSLRLVPSQHGWLSQGEMMKWHKCCKKKNLSLRDRASTNDLQMFS